MKLFLPLACLLGFLVLTEGCHIAQKQQQAAAQPERRRSRRVQTPVPEGPAGKLISELTARFAPDPHMAVYNVTVEPRGKQVKVAGEVDCDEAKAETIRAFEAAGYKVDVGIQVLPDPELGDKAWVLATLSVANGRELPDHKEELGTQLLMGHAARVLKANRHWYYVQSQDGYLSWVEKGTVALCTGKEVEDWRKSRLAIVTAYEDRVLEKAESHSPEVSDVVHGDLVKVVSDSGDWLKVEFPDGRGGFLPKHSTEDFAAWKQARKPTAESIEQTGRTFIGRPYLWGGNSPKGMDCSGFVKQTFWLNGILLHRNASEQARQGKLINTDNGLANLQKGDLMFFGFGGRSGEQPWVTHVAIYLGEKQFIQSSERVRISSLQADSPIYDPYHGRSLLFARRVLGEPDVPSVE